MSTDNKVQEMYRSNPVIKALSELPPHVTAQNFFHLAEWANTNSTKNFLHYRFMPDDPVLELCVHHLTQQGFRLSSEQMAKLTECEEELVEDGGDFEDDDFEDDDFEDDDFEDDDFEDDDFEDDDFEEDTDTEEVTVIPHKAPSLKFSPGLSHNLNDGDSGPVHRLIIGDNYQTLAGLQAGLATHPKGIYDLIYIDPPYNTGNGDFRYNDLKVDTEDKWRSTKWASFMETRLILAKRLLKKTGVIFIAIDDNEMHALRLLCDSMFGRHNHLNTLVWNGTAIKNDSKYGSNGHDYMLVYALSKEALKDAKCKWMDTKPGALEAVNAAQKAWDESNNDPAVATNAYRKWVRTLPSSHPAKEKGLKPYNNVDAIGLYQSTDLSFPNGVGPYYDVRHPLTKKPVKLPASGWRANQGTMNSWISEGRVLFGKDETTVPRFKRYLHNHMSIVPSSVITTDRSKGSDHLEDVLGPKQFEYPKDHVELARWFRMAAPKDAKILDFFGGSGTTAESVLLLNQQDGGTREVTIVTSNEGNIGTEVTRERIVRVMTGEGWADGKHHDGYGGRLGVWFAETVEVIDFENDREQGETDHHSWDRGAGQWGAWHSTPILLEHTKSYDVYGGDTGKLSIVFHNIDALNGRVVDDAIEKYPDAQVFLPHSHTYKTTSNSFYVDDVPNAIPLPLGVWSPIQSGVSASVVDSYAKRGGAYIEFIHKLIEQNSTAEEEKETD